MSDAHLSDAMPGYTSDCLNDSTSKDSEGAGIRIDDKGESVSSVHGVAQDFIVLSWCVCHSI